MPNVQEKQLRWYNIALMSFITVWGFGNVVNNYANQGLVVVFSWVFIFALYFIPYALIVGQLGSTFKEGKGGVSTWIKHTMGPGLAYLAAWTYWVVHIPYLAQKPQAILIALGWALKGDGSLIKEYTVVALQGLTLALFVFFMWVASRGMKSLKVVGSVAGIAMFIMSILYVVMAVTAPAITNVEIATTNITWQSFILISILPYHHHLYVGLCGWWGREDLALCQPDAESRKRISEGDALFSRHGCGLRYPRFVGDGNDV